MGKALYGASVDAVFAVGNGSTTTAFGRERDALYPLSGSILYNSTSRSSLCRDERESLVILVREVQENVEIDKGVLSNLPKEEKNFF